MSATTINCCCDRIRGWVCGASKPLKAFFLLPASWWLGDNGYCCKLHSHEDLAGARGFQYEVCYNGSRIVNFENERNMKMIMIGIEVGRWRTW